MSGVRVRGYEPGDLEACRSLWVELTEAHREIYDAPEIGGDDPGSQFDEHLARVGPERLWVAEADGRVVGLVGLIPKGREAEIEPVVVASAARGRGVGRLLIAEVIAAARAGGFALLSVGAVARNARAIGFYHHMGFDTLGEVEMFMSFGDREWRDGETIAGRRFRV